MSNVFISHSNEDKPIVRKLATDLSSYGVRTWFDEWAIQVGDSIIDRINQGIRESDFILVILSKNSVKSRWVQEEIQAALHKEIESQGGVLIPVIVDDVEVPLFLQHIKYIDLSASEKYEKGLLELIRAVQQPRREKTPKPSDLVDVPELAKEVALEVAQILKTSPDGIRLKESKTDSHDPNLVFVIIAFSPDMDPIFEGIEAAGVFHGLKVERVKDVLGDYRITNKIIEMIEKARLVVSDLTHERPNVYFEIGYARGIGKTVITVAREGTNVHFDAKDWTCMFYNDSRTLENYLKQRFEFELKSFE